MLAALVAVATIGLAVALPGSVAFDILNADLTELRQDPAGCNAPDVGPGPFGVTAGMLDHMDVSYVLHGP